MKIAQLAAFGHNVADSLASGICLTIGMYNLDVFGEAAASSAGHIIVDFKRGTTSGSSASRDLDAAVRKFAEALPKLAVKNGINPADIKVLQARFGTDKVVGPHFTVTVEAEDGRRSVDRYVGSPGKRFGRPRRSKASEPGDGVVTRARTRQAGIFMNVAGRLLAFAKSMR